MCRMRSLHSNTYIPLPWQLVTHFRFEEGGVVVGWKCGKGESILLLCLSLSLPPSSFPSQSFVSFFLLIFCRKLRITTSIVALCKASACVNGLSVYDGRTDGRDEISPFLLSRTRLLAATEQHRVSYCKQTSLLAFIHQFFDTMQLQ